MRKYFIIVCIAVLFLFTACENSDSKENDNGNAGNDGETTDLNPDEAIENTVEVEDHSEQEPIEADDDETVDLLPENDETIDIDEPPVEEPEDDLSEPDDEINDNDPVVTDCPDGWHAYKVAGSFGTKTTTGCWKTVEVNGDPTDIYVPNITDVKIFTSIYMQGGKVDKQYYSDYCKIVSAYGFVVAIANHNSLSGKNMTEQKVFNQVWDYIKDQDSDSASYLYDRVNTTKVGIMGHSLGGIAATNIVMNKCGPPTCFGFAYTAPQELSALVLYGTNTKNPMIGNFTEVKNGTTPVAYVQGTVDGQATHEDTLKTYEEKTTGKPKSMISIIGANHFGITNMNNPEGADPDSNDSTISQEVAKETTGRWSGMYLRAHLYEDASSIDYIYGENAGADDPNAEIISER